jgi:FtsP/CotA-like multicopper oxidase with cupredoxin domain
LTALAAVAQPGRKTFELELQRGTSELLPGRPTETWGVNGDHLGPTLRAQRGDQVTVHVANALPQATTLHWHGMHLPAQMDGGPHQMIEPARRWSASWTVDQPAATLWYHPHPDGATEAHTYRGIAGMFIVGDPAEARLPLPREYGVDDIPLIVQDKRLADDGSLEESESLISPTGRLGDEILVNGTRDPHFDVRHERVRLRLLNASTARIYEIGRDDGEDLALIGTDGGLLEAPRPVRRILLSPGERAEVVASFRPGERVVLRSFEPDLGTNAWEGRFSGAGDSFDLVELRAAQQLAPSPQLPDQLVDLEPARVPDGVKVRRFELRGRSINGLEMDMERIDEIVRPRDTEVWEVENTSGTPHNFHPHGVHFQVVDADGSVLPALTGWKDTIYVPPGQRYRLLVRFEDYHGHHAPYMFHCHLMQHEDRGMMGQFVVRR